MSTYSQLALEGQAKDLAEQLSACADQAERVQAGLDTMGGIYTTPVRFASELRRMAVSARLAAEAARQGRNLTADDIRQWAKANNMRASVR